MRLRLTLIIRVKLKMQRLMKILRIKIITLSTMTNKLHITMKKTNTIPHIINMMINFITKKTIKTIVSQHHITKVNQDISNPLQREIKKENLKNLMKNHPIKSSLIKIIIDLFLNKKPQRVESIEILITEKKGIILVEETIKLIINLTVEVDLQAKGMMEILLAKRTADVVELLLNTNTE